MGMIDKDHVPDKVSLTAPWNLPVSQRLLLCKSEFNSVYKAHETLT